MGTGLVPSFLILIAIVFAGEIATASSLVKKVGVYAGPGACKDCPQELAALARKLGPGFSVELIPPGSVRPEVLRGLHMFIQPGGDNTMQVKRAIGPQGEQAIKDFVAHGGRYLGICLGATLASTGVDEDNRAFLGLLPVRSREYDTANLSARLGKVNVSFKGHGERSVFLQDPPYLEVLPSGRGKVQVLATYPDGRAAAVSGKYGRGTALLLGPHFEAASDWASHHKLDDRDGNEQNIFMDFLREAAGVSSVSPSSQSAPRSDAESGKAGR